MLPLLHVDGCVYTQKYHIHMIRCNYKSMADFSQWNEAKNGFFIYFFLLQEYVLCGGYKHSQKIVRHKYSDFDLIIVYFMFITDTWTSVQVFPTFPVNSAVKSINALVKRYKPLCKSYQSYIIYAYTELPVQYFIQV